MSAAVSSDHDGVTDDWKTSLITLRCTWTSRRSTPLQCDPRSSPRGSPTTPPLASKSGQPPPCLNKERTAMLKIKYGHCRNKKVLATANRSRDSIRLAQTALWHMSSAWWWATDDDIFGRMDTKHKSDRRTDRQTDGRTGTDSQTLSASAAVIHYEEALYQLDAPLPLPGVSKDRAYA